MSNDTLSFSSRGALLLQETMHRARERGCPTVTEVRSDQHVLLATDHQGRVFKGSTYETYGDAIASWYRHDDARRAGLRPHVKYYEVRSEDDPKAQEALVPVRSNSLFRSVIRRSRGFGDPVPAARAAIRRWIPEPQDRRFPGHTRRQGDGGWYFEADGITLAQGRYSLADVAKRRGWIVADANGRWHVANPLETNR